MSELQSEDGRVHSNGDASELQPTSPRPELEGSRSGNGGNGPAETAAAIEAGLADPVTGGALTDEFGRDRSLSYPVDPLLADESRRWERAKQSYAERHPEVVVPVVEDDGPVSV